MRIPNEIKAGIVVLSAMAIGAYFFIKTSSEFQEETYTIKTYFNYAGDLKKDAAVKLAGVYSGRVSEIRFIYDSATKIECVLTLNQSVKIRKDAVAYIGTSGFIGDTYIGLTPGSSPEFLQQGEAILSEDPIEMRELFKKADKIANELEKTLVEVRTVAINVNGMVVENRPAIQRMVTHLESTGRNFEEFSAEVKKHPWKLLFKGE
ncbi:organic solvents resistance ABC transporter periplasmic protein [Candidatus Omnitrophus magneticus]|uniref:Organic solvents resistance ABC transporter periplasmic protein n=1 Tax=Candidatus Omnitrophus magneticus TaxID=1609969 RepID=A0A0F0CRH9_9BACT|nr:organic solvents resistance ABC transporter periplasmic protein [Candidatus Omnitrophus magneticus]